MQKVRVQLNGKINLSLNILGISDCMHLIESVMQSISIFDVVTCGTRLDDKVNIRFLGTDAVDRDNNTVIKTVNYLRRRFGDFGVDIVVEKNLPIAGGLGGSSADAAAVLIALNLLYDFDKRGLDMLRAAEEIGSDVGFMLRGGCGLVTGTGGIITPITNNLPLNIVIASCGIGISSKDAYKEFDRLNPSAALCPSDNAELIKMLGGGQCDGIKYFANALEGAAESLGGGIQKVKNALLEAGATAAVMTGSGSCVSGFFDCLQAADSAALRLRKKGFYAKSCVSTKEGAKII